MHEAVLVQASSGVRQKHQSCHSFLKVQGICVHFRNNPFKSLKEEQHWQLRKSSEFKPKGCITHIDSLKKSILKGRRLMFFLKKSIFSIIEVIQTLSITDVHTARRWRPPSCLPWAKVPQSSVWPSGLFSLHTYKCVGCELWKWSHIFRTHEHLVDCSDSWDDLSFVGCGHFTSRQERWEWPSWWEPWH